MKPFTTDHLDSYDELFHLVIGTVYAKIGNIQDAEDITQNVLIEFFEKSAREVIEHPRKWVLAAVRYKLLEYFKSVRKTNDELHLQDAFDDVNLTYVNGFHDARIIISSIIEEEDFFKNRQEQKIFDLIAYQRYTFTEVSTLIGLTRRQVEYTYKMLAQSLLDRLRKKGIQQIEDLL